MAQSTEKEALLTHINNQGCPDGVTLFLTLRSGDLLMRLTFRFFFDQCVNRRRVATKEAADQLTVKAMRRNGISRFAIEKVVDGNNLGIVRLEQIAELDFDCCVNGLSTNLRILLRKNAIDPHSNTDR
jgi:hypothetical protein